MHARSSYPAKPPQGVVAARVPPGRRPPVHRYMTPVTHEMTPAETEAQRRLVRASILAKPA